MLKRRSGVLEGPEYKDGSRDVKQRVFTWLHVTSHDLSITG